MQKPSELELKILSVLWDNGPQTVRTVLELLPDRKQRAYTTILSTMQVMERKGFLNHSRDGASHVFQPVVQREEVMRPMMGDLMRNVFSGRPSAVLQCLLDEASVNKSELTEIRRLIREYSKQLDQE
ncbi:MAG: BlaI/MecI/CopY family transcriptional regulator [Planctomycetales bacterium]|jgi:BlaI family penicillinase repressor